MPVAANAGSKSAQREFGGVNGLTQQSFEGGAGGMLVLSGPARSRKPTENRLLNCLIDGAVDTPRAIGIGPREKTFGALGLAGFVA